VVFTIGIKPPEFWVFNTYHLM